MTARGSDTRPCGYADGLRRSCRGNVTSHGRWATSAWAIANVAFDGKEEATLFARGQFAWNGFLRECDEILGILEDANYSDALIAG